MRRSGYALGMELFATISIGAVALTGLLWFTSWVEERWFEVEPAASSLDLDQFTSGQHGSRAAE